MKILLDLQACQGESRHRGIGRYALALAKAMLRCGGDRHEFWVAANAGFKDDSIEFLQRELAGSRLPPGRFVTFETQGPTAANAPADNERRLERGQLVRQAVVDMLRPDFVHVASLFEGMDDCCISTIPADAHAAPTAVTLYDLVPLLNRADYLFYPNGIDWYYRHLESLRRARLLLAISESSRQEALKYLDWPAERVVNISTAVDAKFKPGVPSPARVAALKRKFGLRRPLIMSAGVVEVRKNIDALIRAFAALPQALRDAHQMALVGIIPPTHRVRFEALMQQSGLAPDAVVMTGYVDDAELIDLYNLCKLFVFPSWHEGFGLPALEAMACGAPVIAANTSSLPEVVGRRDALFDPFSDDAIRDAMQRALENDAVRASLATDGLVRAKQFSWDASAARALAAMEAAAQSPPAVIASETKPRLAYVPMASLQGTSIIREHMPLLLALSAHYDIELISDGPIDPAIPIAWPARSQRWFRDHAERFDRVMFQMLDLPLGNGELALLRRIPGSVLLHHADDAQLADWLAANAPTDDALRAALYRGWGYAGLTAAGRNPDWHALLSSYPLAYADLQLAEGVVVVRRAGASEPTWQPGERAQAAIARIEWPSDAAADTGNARTPDLQATATGAACTVHTAIEATRTHGTRARLTRALAELVARTADCKPEPGDIRSAVQALADAFPSALAPRQLLIDVTALLEPGARHANQRAQVLALLRTPPPGFRVEPVCVRAGEAFCRHARAFACSLLGIDRVAMLSDDPIDVAPGDQWLGFVHAGADIALPVACFRRIRQRGAWLHFLLDTDATADDTIARAADSLIVHSRRQAERTRQSLQGADLSRAHPLAIFWLHDADDAGAAEAAASTRERLLSCLVGECAGFRLQPSG